MEYIYSLLYRTELSSRQQYLGLINVKDLKIFFFVIVKTSINFLMLLNFEKQLKKPNIASYFQNSILSEYWLFWLL